MRLATLDASSQPQKNLFINPSFEKASFSTTKVERFRNFVTNPGMATTTNWLASGSGASVAIDNTEFHSGSSSIKVTVAANTAADRGVAQYSLSNGTLAPGTYTASMWIKAPSGVSIRLGLEEYTPSVFVSSVSSIIVGNDSWQRVLVTKVLTNTGNTLRLLARTNAANTPQVVFWIDSAMLTLGTDVPEYFDGSTTTHSFANDAVGAWVGAANASASTLSSAHTERWRNLAAVPRCQVLGVSSGALSIRPNSGRWFGSGAAGVYTVETGSTPVGEDQTFVRKTWTTATGSGSGDTGVGFGASGLGGYPVVPGEVYTFSTYVRHTSPASKGFYGKMFFYNSSGAGLGSPNYIVGPNALVSPSDEWTRVSYTFTVPAGAAFLFPVMDCQATNSAWLVGSTMDMTCAMMTKTPYLTPYFDGEVVGSDILGLDYSASWTGVPQGSQSIVTGPLANTEVYRNYCTNPSFETDTNGWNAWQGAASSSARITSGGFAGTCTYRGTVGAAATVALSVSHTVAAAPVMSAGQTWTQSAYVRSNRTMFVTPIINWYIQAGATTVSSANGTAVSIPANTWTRVTVTGAVPATATTGRIQLTTNVISWAVGDWVEIDAVQYTQSPTAVDYFDGSFTTGYFADMDFTPSWVTTAHASNSLIKVTMPAGTSVGVSRPANQSFKSPSTGKMSYRVSSQILYGGTTQDTFGTLGNLPTVASMLGKTYTITGRITLTKVQTNNPTGFARGFRINMFAGATDVSIPVTYTSTAPNAIGTHEVRGTFTVPTNVTAWNFMRVYNGARAFDEDVFWDQIALVEGKYTGPYLDGDSVAAVWQGTPHNSTSLGYP